MTSLSITKISKSQKSNSRITKGKQNDEKIANFQIQKDSCKDQLRFMCININVDR